MIDKITEKPIKEQLERASVKYTNAEKTYLPVFENFHGVTGFFSLKNGTVDGWPYDNPRLFAQVGVENAVRVWPKQIHKTHIAVVRTEDIVPVKTDTPAGIVIPDTDGLITNLKNVLLTTVHADCLAVFCYDPVKEAIGLSHAGWRGTCAGISAEMISAMKKEYSCDPGSMHIYIGPGISRCCFEVGPEVAQAFTENWDFAEECISRTPEDITNGKYHIDIKEINRRQLKQAGIPESQIQVSGHCTCCEPELFCSYRREGGTYMRMGGGLCMNEQRR